MLVLERKAGQSVILNTKQGRIKVKISKLRPGAVQLAIDAPYDIQVHREELRNFSREVPAGR